MDCSGGRAEAVEKVPERREETFFVGWFSGVGKRVIRSAEAGASEERAGAFRGGLSFGEDISHSFKLIACGQLLLSRAL